MIWSARVLTGISFTYMDDVVQKPARTRLKFIDLARTIAILLMLEGHFVGMALTESARDPSNPIYAAWNLVRGFTAPLFFTVAGMIFVFLLSGENDTPFFKRERVRKGFRRSAELLFWGYALQVTVQNIPGYFRGEFETWLFAFHVLQCIGVGLVMLILISAAQRASRKVSLTIWYAAAAAVSLGGYIWLKGLPNEMFVPAGWPPIIQNAFHGPRSIFPIFPWFSYAFLGGAMGAYVRATHHQPATLKSCVWFLILAASLKLLGLGAVLVPIPHNASEGLTWFTGRAWEVVAFLGVLRAAEICFGIGLSQFLRVGRETFAIYILHVIVLYGGIFGFGLNDLLENKLSAWQAASGAVVFIAVFTAYAIALNHWKTRKLKNT